jgi:hypothetical protein
VYNKVFCAKFSQQGARDTDSLTCPQLKLGHQNNPRVMFAAWNRRPVIITENSAGRIRDTTNIKWSKTRVRRYYEITIAFVICRRILKIVGYSVELDNTRELWIWTVLKWSCFGLFKVRFHSITGGKVEKPSVMNVICGPRFQPEYSRICRRSANNSAATSVPVHKASKEMRQSSWTGQSLQVGVAYWWGDDWQDISRVLEKYAVPWETFW